MLSRWNDHQAPDGLLERRVYASRLLGAERSLVLWGGGNTSVKLTEQDHRSEAVPVLRVKGSGSDLRTIEAQHFAGVRHNDVLRLRDVATMGDEQMVEYLTRSLLSPADARPSIETLLHGFLPHRWVDHTHADAIVALTNQPDGAATVRRVFGERVAMVPWVRPGFELSKAVMEQWERERAVEGVVLVNHGLITFGEEARESYERTIALVDAAERFIDDARGGAPRFAGVELPAAEAPAAPERPRRVAVAAAALRGAFPFPVVLRHDGSPEMVRFATDPALRAAAERGPATPDHALRTKGWPALATVADDAAEQELAEAVRSAVTRFVERYEAYAQRHATAETPVALVDQYPRIVLVPGLGAFAAGHTAQQAQMAGDIYRQTIEVVADATAVGEYRPVAEAALFDIEYWPLELYKLTLAPPPAPLAGQVAVVTGAAGGIGRAIAERLAAEGACVAIADIDGAGAERAAAAIRERPGQSQAATAVAMDVSDERSVIDGFEEIVARFGGIDILVSNAGSAVVSPLAALELTEWERSLAVNATGHFMVSREAVRWLQRQRRKGREEQQGPPASIVFVSSKNVFAPGAEFGAYSAAKAAETQLAKVLAIECGGDGIRVNIVNPDAVFSGSNLWSEEVRASRATAHGVATDELEAFYARRNLLGVRILPEDVAAAVAFLTSEAAAKITGCTITVDGGVAAAFPR